MKKFFIFFFFLLTLFNGAVLYYLGPKLLEEQKITDETSPSSANVKNSIINTFMLGEALLHFQKECYDNLTGPNDLLKNYLGYLEYGGCGVLWKQVKKADGEMLLDGWGVPIEFISENEEQLLRSFGKDKSAGGVGDNEDLTYSLTRKTFL